MLVLSRKKNESIVINNDVTVTVVEIRGDKVRLGIVAPKEVPVHRQEVFDAIHSKDAVEPAPRLSLSTSPSAKSDVFGPASSTLSVPRFTARRERVFVYRSLTAIRWLRRVDFSCRSSSYPFSC